MSRLHPGESHSLWIEDLDLPVCSQLPTALETDVCVVGAGLGGLITAYLLMKEGKKVCILEDFEIGSGQSSKTTAHFVTALDTRYYELERLHGERGARIAAQSHVAALDQIEDITRTERFNCDLERVNGYLFVERNRPTDELYRELLAARKAGLNDVYLEDNALLGPSLCLPRQIQLHPLKLMKGLAERLLENGVEIYTRTRVTEVIGGDFAFVKTLAGYSVRADSIVVATNSPVNNLFAIHTKQAPYRTYALAVRIPKGSVPRALYWDTMDPYHYVRVAPRQGTHDLLIVGGEDHKTGQKDDPIDCYLKLEAWMRERFPLAEDVVHHWSGQIVEPVDGLPFLGHNPLDKRNVYVITGHSGTGMTDTTIGGILVTDQILGRRNPWESLYDPSRITLKAVGAFVKENANVAAQYADWLSGHAARDVDELALGEGLVVRHGLDKLAAYKDSLGRVSFKSATCPHLGCVVNWNKAEKSWDCPCHGSRFDCHGRVISGPAVRDLKDADAGDRAAGEEVVVPLGTPI